MNAGILYVADDETLARMRAAANERIKMARKMNGKIIFTEPDTTLTKEDKAEIRRHEKAMHRLIAIPRKSRIHQKD